MQRLLPALAAFALVIAGVGGGILLLTARDHSSITATSPSQDTPGGSSPGPYGLPIGNVVITYGKPSDRVRIDQLAERLGAIDTKAARAAGQALISKKERAGTIIASNGTAKAQFTTTNDPALAAFVRQYLGRTQ